MLALGIFAVSPYLQVFALSTPLYASAADAVLTY